jgi:hypothetical protein
MLAFDGEALNEAIAQVAQQTGWSFELEDPALGEMPVAPRYAFAASLGSKHNGLSLRDLRTCAPASLAHPRSSARLFPAASSQYRC